MKRQPGIIHRAAAGQPEDQFSKLPDEVIHDILARLNSSKQPAKLAILSKRWNHLWLSYPVFDHHHRESPNATRIKNLEKFLTAAGKKFSNLQHVAAVRIKLLGYCDSDVLDKLLGFVAKATQEVRFGIKPCYCDYVVIRKGLFNNDHCRGLKVVKLKVVRFPSGSSVRFGASLQVLSLKSVRFPGENDEGDGILNSMIQSAPYLEALTLKDIRGILRFQIRNCLNLKTLKASEFCTANFEISGTESLEILHVFYWRKEEFQVSLPPNNSVKVVHIAGAHRMKSNEELNELISKFPRLEELKLDSLPLITQLKINVSSHKFLRSICMHYSALQAAPTVIEIDAPSRLSKLVLNMQNMHIGFRFPDVLINQADSKPVVQVSICWELCRQIPGHEFKQFLSNLSRFQLTFEFSPLQRKIIFPTSDVDDQSPIPIIEHLKISPHLCDGVAFVNTFFRNCHPKMISFTETRDEVAEKNVLQLQNMWKYLASSCKSAKMMKRVINDDGIEEDREINLVSFLGDPKRCWIVLDWH